MAYCVEPCKYDPPCDDCAGSEDSEPKQYMCFECDLNFLDTSVCPECGGCCEEM